MSIIHALQAEPVKYRRSATLYLALGVPALILGVITLYILFNLMSTYVLHHSRLLAMPDETSWHALVRIFDNPWQVMVVPFGLVILGTVATQMLHANRMWPFVAVQPVSRGALYLAQVAGLQGVVLAGMLLLGLGYLVIGVVFRFGPVDWHVVLVRHLLSWAASFAAISIQVWLGTRFRSFAWPMTFGIAGVVGSFLLRAMGAWFLGPWCFPYMVQERAVPAVAASIIVGSCFVLLGLLDCSRQDWV